MQEQAAVVKIDRTYSAYHVVRHKTLCVDKARSVFVDFDPFCKECLIKASRHSEDKLLVRNARHDYANVNAAMGCARHSVQQFVSGHKVWPMVLAQDHKRAFDGDKGPNTGGMGAYSPLPFITAEDERYALEKVLQPTADAMVAEGCPFEGVLYGGLMKTPQGIKVIEFNARFGDPETEVVLPRLKSDIVDIFCAVADGGDTQLVWHDFATLGIVLASKGYPGAYEKGCEIKGLDRVEGALYHMGTKADGSRILTSGGRVLFVVGKGATLAEARANALRDVARIGCDNLFHRTDIGHWAFEN